MCSFEVRGELWKYAKYSNFESALYSTSGSKPLNRASSTWCRRPKYFPYAHIKRHSWFLKSWWCLLYFGYVQTWTAGKCWRQKTPFCLKLSSNAQKSVLSWSISRILDSVYCAQTLHEKSVLWICHHDGSVTNHSTDAEHLILRRDQKLMLFVNIIQPCIWI